jgi:hypothetical protein
MAVIGIIVPSVDGTAAGYAHTLMTHTMIHVDTIQTVTTADLPVLTRTPIDRHHLIPTEMATTIDLGPQYTTIRGPAPTDSPTDLALDLHTADIRLTILRLMTNMSPGT